LKAFRSRQERPESLCNRCGRSPKVRMCCCDKSQMAGSEHVQELREEADQIDSESCRSVAHPQEDQAIADRPISVRQRPEHDTQEHGDVRWAADALC
jgi:uncharacterized cysteine cluster protein YcgN (CxxCxxCC family)